MDASYFLTTHAFLRDEKKDGSAPTGILPPTAYSK